MRKLFFLLIFLLPWVVNAQFEVHYNPVSNTVSVDYSGCDFCMLGSIANLNACNEYHDCLGDCYSRSSKCTEGCKTLLGSQYYNWCLHSCCTKQCGEEPVYENTRKIVGYKYLLYAAWDYIPLDPRDKIDHWDVYSFEGIIGNDEIVIPDWHPRFPWPGIHFGHNTCYGISIRVFYEEEDGRSVWCDFIDWTCNFIG